MPLSAWRMCTADPAAFDGPAAITDGKVHGGRLRFWLHPDCRHLAHTKGSALSMWFTVSAVASGGLAGLFLLAFLSSRASRRGVYAGIVASLIFTLWASFTVKRKADRKPRRL